MRRASTSWLKPPGPVAEGLRIGLLGGSFNPPHEGHIHASEIALKRLGLDYVWWLVSPQNPLKSARDTAPLDARIALAARLVHGRRIIVTDVERTLGTRYTADTLTALVRRFPEPRFVWLMGSDNLAGFHRWKDWPRIVALMPVAVVLRPGSELAPLMARAMQRYGSTKRGKGEPIAVLEGPLNRQSSSQLRARALEPANAL